MLFSSKYPLQQWHFKNRNYTVKIQLLEESVKKNITASRRQHFIANTLNA